MRRAAYRLHPAMSGGIGTTAPDAEGRGAAPDAGSSRSAGAAEPADDASIWPGRMATRASSCVDEPAAIIARTSAPKVTRPIPIGVSVQGLRESCMSYPPRRRSVDDCRVLARGGTRAKEARGRPHPGGSKCASRRAWHPIRSVGFVTCVHRDVTEAATHWQISAATRRGEETVLSLAKAGGVQARKDDVAERAH